MAYRLPPWVYTSGNSRADDTRLVYAGPRSNKSITPAVEKNTTPIPYALPCPHRNTKKPRAPQKQLDSDVICFYFDNMKQTPKRVMCHIYRKQVSVSPASSTTAELWWKLLVPLSSTEALSNEKTPVAGRREALLAPQESSFGRGGVRIVPRGALGQARICVIHSGRCGAISE